MPVCTLAFSLSFANLPTGPLRLLRLLRLARMARILKSMPELVTMMKGISVATRAVSASLLMVGMLVYIFAIFLLMLLKDETSVRKRFGSLSRCMWTLIMDGTLMDSPGSILTHLLDLQEVHSAIAVAVFMVFLLLS